MSLWKAILLGLVQGLTEFLPVSSSGHLVIIKQLFGMETEGGLLDQAASSCGSGKWRLVF